MEVHKVPLQEESSLSTEVCAMLVGGRVHLEAVAVQPSQ